MIHGRSKWTEKLPGLKTLEHGQDDNGMHYATIRDAQGFVESGTTCKTKAEVWHWLIVEHGLLDPESRSMYKAAERSYEYGLLP